MNKQIYVNLPVKDLERSKAFFGETISNPQIDVLDIPGVAEVAHANGVPLIVDNTIATPYLIQPFKHGADIVVHSATKYLGGHGSAIACPPSCTTAFPWPRRCSCTCGPRCTSACRRSAAGG